MKKQRMMAIVLSASMAALSLAGCGGSGSDQTTAAPTTAASTAAASEATTTAAAEETSGAETTAQAKETGKVPKIVIYNNTGSLTNASGKELGSDSEAIEELHQYILDNVGVDVEVIVPPTNSADANQKLSTLLAGGEQLDIWWGDWRDYYQDGIILPLNDLLAMPEAQTIIDNWGPLDDPEWGNTKDQNGTIWGLPRTLVRGANPIFVRNDWLDQLGMDMPKTIDELNEYLYAVKELDPYGNGETVPLVLQGGDDPVNVTHDTLLGGYVKTGAGRFLDETDGKIKPCYLAEGYEDFIKQLHQWYADGIIHKEFLSQKKQAVQQLITSGRAGATAVYFTTVTGQEDITRKSVNLDTSKYDYTWGWSEDGVKGPNGNYVESAELANNKVMLISSKCEDPEAAMRFVGWAHQLEVKRILKRGIFGKYWEWDPNAENAEEDGLVVENKDAPTYIGDFDVAVGGPIARDSVVYYDDGVRVMSNYWLTFVADRLPYTIYNPIEAEVPFDTKKLEEVAPIADVSTYRHEELAKFITGDRSLDTWDDFIQEMYDLGLDAYIEECTRQYNEYMGK